MTSMTAQEMGFLSPPTVLVVDDDPDMREFLSFAIESWANVITAANGAEGIAQCRTQLPDLVLLDVNMPGLDGFDVINELKHDSTTRHIPVMFITAETFQEVESECLESGAADYVAKPINPRVLTARARTHILLKQQSDKLSELAIVDGLTGSMTRTAFDERLAEELSRSRRSKQPFVLAVVAVDQMEEYVATYGQLAADDVMAAAADVVRRVARRQSDIVGRFGPHEIALLLPDIDALRAEALTERIRALFGELAIPHRLAPAGRVDVSIRVAEGADHDSVAGLLAAVG